MYRKNTSKSLNGLKRLKSLKHLSLMGAIGLGFVASSAQVRAQEVSSNKQEPSLELIDDSILQNQSANALSEAAKSEDVNQLEGRPSQELDINSKDEGAKIASHEPAESQQGFFSRLMGSGPQTDPAIKALIAAAKSGNVKQLEDILNQDLDVNDTDADGRTALYWAAYRGHAAVVKMLLEHGANPDLQDKDDTTALYWAARLGYTETVEMLVEQGANPDLQDKEGTTALYQASSNGHTETAKMLLEHGANPDLEDKDNTTALYQASRLGHTEAVKMLLEHGANPDLQDKDDTMALYWAVRLGHTQTAKMLLEQGANPDPRDKEGRTALYWMAYLGHTETAKMLLEQGANPDLQDKDDTTALYWAAYRGHTEVVKMLLERGANPDLQDKEGTTPLHNAAKYGYPEAIKMLLKRGANPDLEDKEGTTALHNAAKYGYPEAIKMLLEHGANPDAQDKEGRTPLHNGAKYGYPEAMKMLLEHGADLHIQDKDGKTSLDEAEDIRWKWWRWLKSAEAQMQMLQQARLKYELKIEALLEQSLKDAAQNEEGKMPVELFLEQPKIKRLFTEYIHKTLPSGLTPLGIAAKYGDIKAMELFLSYGAQLQAKDAEGFTAMQRALEFEQTQAVNFLEALLLNAALLAVSEQGDAKAVERLLNLNADINATDAQGCTPLMLALKHDHIDLAWELIKKGADLNAVSKEGKTALYYAAGSADPLSAELVQYLRQQNRHGSQGAVFNAVNLAYAYLSGLFKGRLPSIY